MNTTIQYPKTDSIYLKSNMAIQKIKTLGFSALTLTALLMALFMIFNITYPLNYTQKESNKHQMILSRQKATYDTIFTGKARRVGDQLIIIAAA